jgi:hypothetical protein
MAPRNKPPATGTEVAKTSDVVNLPETIERLDEAMLAEMQGVEGAGRSDHAEDLGTPLMYIAQSNTPQVNKNDAKFVKGLEAGMVFNNLTGQFFDAEGEGVGFLPCYYKVVYDEWTPRDDGGGYHGEHPRDTELLRSAKPFVNPKTGKTRGDIFVLDNGNHLKLTHKYFCILEKTWRPIVIPMASTNLGASRMLQNMIDAQQVIVGDRIVTKPAFWSRFLLKTGYKEFDEGSAYVFNVSLNGSNENKMLRDLCKVFALSCQRGNVKIAQPIDDNAASSGNVDDKDIPV